MDTIITPVLKADAHKARVRPRQNMPTVEVSQACKGTVHVRHNLERQLQEAYARLETGIARFAQPEILAHPVRHAAAEEVLSGEVQVVGWRGQLVVDACRGEEGEEGEEKPDVEACGGEEGGLHFVFLFLACRKSAFVVWGLLLYRSGNLEFC